MFCWRWLFLTLSPAQTCSHKACQFGGDGALVHMDCAELRLSQINKRVKTGAGIQLALNIKQHSFKGASALLPGFLCRPRVALSCLMSCLLQGVHA